MVHQLLDLFVLKLELVISLPLLLHSLRLLILNHFESQKKLLGLILSPLFDSISLDLTCLESFLLSLSVIVFDLHSLVFDALTLSLNQLNLSESLSIFLLNDFEIPQPLLLLNFVLLAISADYFFPLDPDEAEPFLLIVIFLLYLSFVILPLYFQCLNLQSNLLLLKFDLLLKPSLLSDSLRFLLSKFSLELSKPLVILLLLPFELVSQLL